jgi:hypothetical protein
VIKTIYLATRNPSTTPEEFVQNWKQHAVLAASFPSINNSYLGVIQCRSIAGYPGLEGDKHYDGGNILTLKSLLAAVEVYDDPNIERLLTDERRVFGAYVSESSMTVHESVLVDLPIDRIVLLEFVRRGPDTGPEDFLRGWTGAFARHFTATPTFGQSVGRYVHDHVILPTPTGYDFDGISETWLERAEDAPALVEQSDASRAAVGGDRFDVGMRLLLEVSHAFPRAR